MINHCDVRRSVCATNVNAKEKKSFAKSSEGINSSLDWRQFRFTNEIITVEQKQQITETIHKYKLFPQSKFTYS